MKTIRLIDRVTQARTIRDALSGNAHYHTTTTEPLDALRLIREDAAILDGKAVSAIRAGLVKVRMGAEGAGDDNAVNALDVATRIVNLWLDELKDVAETMKFTFQAKGSFLDAFAIVDTAEDALSLVDSIADEILPDLVDESPGVMFELVISSSTVRGGATIHTQRAIDIDVLGLCPQNVRVAILDGLCEWVKNRLENYEPRPFC